jgi:hypothetical protein
MIVEQAKKETMLVNELKELDYNFSSLPIEVKDSISLLEEIESVTDGDSNQQLSSLDREIFEIIEIEDPRSEIVKQVRSKYDFESNHIINDGFNTTGLIQLDTTELNEIAEVDDIVNLDNKAMIKGISKSKTRTYSGGGLINYGFELGFLPFSERMVVAEMPEDVSIPLLQNVKQALTDIPRLYAQDGKGKNAIAYLHYFSGASDWYITELDPDSKEGFGYAVLNEDWINAEFGYIPITQFAKADNVQLDLHWKYKTINQILEKRAPEFTSEPIERYEDPKDKPTNFKGLNFKYKNPYDLNRAIEQYLDDNTSETKVWSANEINFIKLYSGYGGLQDFGNFTDDELKGLLYEYYTPDEVVKKMWGLAYKYGYGASIGTSVLEPSVGTGNFFKYAPSEARKVAYEINSYSIRITQILFPTVKVIKAPFEKVFIKKNLSIRNKTKDLEKFSLVIGNPPYGKISSFNFKMGEDSHTKAKNYTEYFISRGIDLLVPGGLLIMIVGAEQYTGGTLFLDSPITPAKKSIWERAELIDAYRLPRKLFERTGVATEIVIFKKY